MNSAQRKHVSTLERRRDKLAALLGDWKGGDRTAASRELAALRWAIQVVRNADAHGVLADLGGSCR